MLAPLPGAPGVAVAICARHPAARGAAGIAPCVHALSLAALAAAGAAGTTRIALATGDCAVCPVRPRITLADRVAELAALAAPRGGGAPALHPASRVEIAAVLDERAGLDPARRALFRRAVGVAQPDLADPPDPVPALAGLCAAGPGPVPHAPRLNPLSCVGCDACLRICPHDVLALDDGPDGLAYVADAARCTGCALCVDICEVGAVTLDRLAPPPPPVPLVGFRCRACGVAVHEPPAAHRDDLCRICRRTGHFARLHQII